MLAHDRQRCLGHPYGSEQIGLQLAAQLVLGELFDHPEVPVAGIVDHYVQPPEAPGGLLDGRLVSGAVGDVQLQRQHVVVVVSTRASSVSGRRAVAAT